MSQGWPEAPMDETHLESSTNGAVAFDATPRIMVSTWTAYMESSCLTYTAVVWLAMRCGGFFTWIISICSRRPDRNFFRILKGLLQYRALSPFCLRIGSYSSITYRKCYATTTSSRGCDIRGLFEPKISSQNMKLTYLVKNQKRHNSGNFWR
jgi:hypothetical protein